METEQAAANDDLLFHQTDSWKKLLEWKNDNEKYPPAGKPTVDFRLAYARAADCNINAGLLLAQIIYWHLPTSDKAGKELAATKLQVKRWSKKAGKSHLWVVKTSREWFLETCLTESQIRTARVKLIGLGIIDAEEHRYNGLKMWHYRIIPEGLMRAMNDGHKNFSQVPPVKDHATQAAVKRKETARVKAEKKSEDEAEAAIIAAEEHQKEEELAMQYALTAAPDALKQHDRMRLNSMTEGAIKAPPLTYPTSEITTKTTSIEPSPFNSPVGNQYFASQNTAAYSANNDFLEDEEPEGLALSDTDVPPMPFEETDAYVLAYANGVFTLDQSNAPATYPAPTLSTKPPVTSGGSKPAAPVARSANGDQQNLCGAAGAEPASIAASEATLPAPLLDPDRRLSDQEIDQMIGDVVSTDAAKSIYERFRQCTGSYPCATMEKYYLLKLGQHLSPVIFDAWATLFGGTYNIYKISLDDVSKRAWRFTRRQLSARATPDADLTLSDFHLNGSEQDTIQRARQELAKQTPRAAITLGAVNVIDNELLKSLLFSPAI